MQLILESETIIGDTKDMSKIEEVLSENLVADCIEELKCNGNKENVGQDNVIITDKVTEKEAPEEVTDDSVAKIPTTADINDENGILSNGTVNNLQQESQENSSINIIDKIVNTNECLQDSVLNEKNSTVADESSSDIPTLDNDTTEIFKDTQETSEKSSAPIDTVNQICDSVICENDLNLKENIEEAPSETTNIAVDSSAILHEEKASDKDEPICIQTDNVDQESTEPPVSDSNLNKYELEAAQMDCEVSLKGTENNKQTELDISSENTETNLENNLEIVGKANHLQVNENEQNSHNEKRDILPQSDSENIADREVINDEKTSTLNDSHDDNLNNINTDQSFENSDAIVDTKSENVVENVELIKNDDKKVIVQEDIIEIEKINSSSVETKTDVCVKMSTDEGDDIFRSNKKNEALEVDTNKESVQIKTESVGVDDSIIEPAAKRIKLDNIDEKDTELAAEEGDTVNLNSDSIDVDVSEPTPEEIVDVSVSDGKNVNETPVIEVNDDVKIENNESIIIEDHQIKDESSILSTDSKKDDMDVEEVNVTTDDSKVVKLDASPRHENTPETNTVAVKPFSKLSNMLNILSDDEEEPCKEDLSEPKSNANTTKSEKTCINIEEDDDIMLIDEDVTSLPEKKAPESDVPSSPKPTSGTDSETGEEIKHEDAVTAANDKGKDTETIPDPSDPKVDLNIAEKDVTEEIEKETLPPIPENFLKTAKKSIADMTRAELEEFCVLKIVESVVERSNLGEIKSKLKTMAQSLDEYKKKALLLMKQNRDLQVVLKSVQEEQKKMSQKTLKTPIVPLKITRSVGMQVLMIEKTVPKKKSSPPTQAPNSVNVNQAPKSTPKSPLQNPRTQKPPANNLIPVPRLVPANSPMPKLASAVNLNPPAKITPPTPNGVKPSPPPPQPSKAEKRSINRVQAVTVDLTDDEPPAKMVTRNSPVAPVRVVAAQNLMQQKQTFTQNVNSPRKVYIPISGPTAQVRQGQTIMLKPVPAIRQRVPTPQMPRMTTPARMNRVTTGLTRHPAPLPAFPQWQCQSPTWKALPPAPDLRLSKVENGIVISWKIDGYQEDSYEEIASYQLFAYQETSSPPSTSLWKKIGDVKALPLPMACTLTQFMAGFKYYFAVRAVDVKSRVGPFSLPGSILLLNKM